MAEIKKCSFCYRDIEQGTGQMYVKKDGTVYNFCSNKCYKNMIELKRTPRTTEWTVKAASEKAIRVKTAQKADAAPAAAPAEPAKKPKAKKE
jgi:large subunit ribosomal protein L24e